MEAFWKLPVTFLAMWVWIRLEFNQSEGKKPILNLVNFALIGQILI